jgi:hypothetical protein
MATGVLGLVKISPRVPSPALVWQERRRTLTSAVVDWAWTVALEQGCPQCFLPSASHGSGGNSSSSIGSTGDGISGSDDSSSWGHLLLAVLGIVVFVDAHFYATHRLLHAEPLFSCVLAVSCLCSGEQRGHCATK